MSDSRQRGLWVNWRVGEGSYVVMSTWLKITMDYSTTWILFKCIDGQPNIDSQSFNIRFSSFEKPIDDDWHFGDKYNSMLWCNIWNASPSSDYLRNLFCIYQLFRFSSVKIKQQIIMIILNSYVGLQVL